MFMKVQRVIFCLLEKLEMFVNCKRNDSSFKKSTNLGYQIQIFGIFLIFEEEEYETI